MKPMKPLKLFFLIFFFFVAFFLFQVNDQEPKDAPFKRKLKSFISKTIVASSLNKIITSKTVNKLRKKAETPEKLLSEKGIKEVIFSKERIKVSNKVERDVYKFFPKGMKKEDVKTIVLHFHSSGFLLGAPAAETDLYELFVVDHGIPVLALDYRKSPDYKIDTIMNDAFNFLKWIKKEYGDIKIILSGSNNGAGMVGLIAHHLRDNNYQLFSKSNIHIFMIYPWLCFEHSKCPVDYLKPYSKNGFILDRKVMSFFESSSRVQDMKEYNLMEKPTTDLPPFFIVSSEYDMLRNEVEYYANLLIKKNGEENGLLRVKDTHSYVLSRSRSLKIAVTTFFDFYKGEF